MQITFGLVMFDNDAEVMEDNTPGKGSFDALFMEEKRALKMLEQNPRIRQVNIYQAIQEIPGVQKDRQLIHMVVRQGYEPIQPK